MVFPASTPYARPPPMHSTVNALCSEECHSPVPGASSPQASTRQPVPGRSAEPASPGITPCIRRASSATLPAQTSPPPHPGQRPARQLPPELLNIKSMKSKLDAAQPKRQTTAQQAARGTAVSTPKGAASLRVSWGPSSTRVSTPSPPPAARTSMRKSSLPKGVLYRRMLGHTPSPVSPKFSAQLQRSTLPPAGPSLPLRTIRATQVVPSAAAASSAASSPEPYRTPIAYKARLYDKLLGTVNSPVMLLHSRSAALRKR